MSKNIYSKYTIRRKNKKKNKYKFSVRENYLNFVCNETYGKVFKMLDL